MSTETQHYVACLDLEGRSCVVVGSGAMAREKVEGLEACGAEVTAVLPAAYDAAAWHDDVLCEAFVTGMEVTIGILGHNPPQAKD